MKFQFSGGLGNDKKKWKVIEKIQKEAKSYSDEHKENESPKEESDTEEDKKKKKRKRPRQETESEGTSDEESSESSSDESGTTSDDESDTDDDEKKSSKKKEKKMKKEDIQESSSTSDEEKSSKKNAKKTKIPVKKWSKYLAAAKTRGLCKDARRTPGKGLVNFIYGIKKKKEFEIIPIAVMLNQREYLKSTIKDRSVKRAKKKIRQRNEQNVLEEVTDDEELDPHRINHLKLAEKLRLTAVACDCLDVCKKSCWDEHIAKVEDFGERFGQERPQQFLEAERAVEAELVILYEANDGNLDAALKKLYDGGEMSVGSIAWRENLIDIPWQNRSSTKWNNNRWDSSSSSWTGGGNWKDGGSWNHSEWNNTSAWNGWSEGGKQYKESELNDLSKKLGIVWYDSEWNEICYDNQSKRKDL